MPQGNGIRRSKDLRARVRKFLILTNERKQMSKSTLRKRIALTATTALFAGMLSVASAPVASGAALHVSANSANIALSAQASDTTTYVATAENSTGLSAITPIAAGLVTVASARSTRLLSKDTSTGTAQTVTMLASGVLSIYGNATTSTAFTATSGAFSSATMTAFAGSVSAATYGDPTTKVFIGVTGNANLAATAIAVLWTAPSSAGTYTISKYSAVSNIPTLASPTDGTLTGQITVTVVATSAGGAYSAAYSACYTKTVVTDAVNLGTLTADSTSSSVVTGAQWYIGIALNDAYAANLSNGNLVATATNGGILNITSTGDGSALSAGTGSTVVAYGTGEQAMVRIDQPTAGAPLTTTVTVSYNGTTVCTKTVTITGAAAAVNISKVATGDLSSTTVNADWLSDTFPNGTASGRNGHYYAQLKDSAGNTVMPASTAEFSMDPATTTTTVTALAVTSVATSTSSTTTYSSSVGTFTCGPAAGSSAVKLRHTSASTGVTISSAAFTARCADNPYTYTAALDKAAYSQGEIGTMTVQFLDSKGNKANSVIAVGASTFVLPMLTLVTATGSATALTDAEGVIKYTFTAGTSSGMTAGTYTGIVDFTGLTAVAATKATPTYKLSSGTSDVAFSEVLKSIVALIASINKQIQALQKLILKR